MAAFEHMTQSDTGNAASDQTHNRGHQDQYELLQPESKPRGLSSIRFEMGPSRKDILNFTNQLAVMVRAGISLQDSLESIGSQMQKEKI